MSTLGGPSAGCSDIAVAVVERDGQFLIGLRPEGAPLAGYWEFPGGKTTPGEAPADAACRECREETGLAVRVVGTYPSAAHDYAHGSVRLTFFACVPHGPVPPLPPRFRWVGRGELVHYRFPPANDSLLRLLAAGAPPEPWA
jgi:8-oxo-dGTP diphosphatase